MQHVNLEDNRNIFVLSAILIPGICGLILIKKFSKN